MAGYVSAVVRAPLARRSALARVAGQSTRSRYSEFCCTTSSTAVRYSSGVKVTRALNAAVAAVRQTVTTAAPQRQVRRRGRRDGARRTRSTIATMAISGAAAAMTRATASSVVLVLNSTPQARSSASANRTYGRMRRRALGTNGIFRIGGPDVGDRAD